MSLKKIVKLSKNAAIIRVAVGKTKCTRFRIDI